MNIYHLMTKEEVDDLELLSLTEATGIDVIDDKYARFLSPVQIQELVKFFTEVHPDMHTHWYFWYQGILYVTDLAYTDDTYDHGLNMAHWKLHSAYVFPVIQDGRIVWGNIELPLGYAILYEGDYYFILDRLSTEITLYRIFDLFTEDTNPTRYREMLVGDLFEERDNCDTFGYIVNRNNSLKAYMRLRG